MNHPIKPFNCEKYDQFISNRNVFGKRYLVFHFQRFDDSTVEMILNEKIDLKEKSGRYLSTQKNLTGHHNPDDFNFFNSFYSHNHSSGGIQSNSLN